MISNLLDKMPSGGEGQRFPVQINEWVDPSTGERFSYENGERKPIGTAPNEQEAEGYVEKSEGPLRKLTHHVIRTGFRQKHGEDRELPEGLSYSA